MKGCFKPFLFVQLAVTIGKRIFQGKGCYRGHILPIGRYHVETLIWTDQGDSTAYGMGLWRRSFLRVGIDWKNGSVKRKTQVHREGNLTMEENTYTGSITYRESHHMDTYPSTGADRRSGQANTNTGPGVRLLCRVWLLGVLEDARPGFAVPGTRLGEKALASPCEGEWRSKRGLETALHFCWPL